MHSFFATASIASTVFALAFCAFSCGTQELQLTNHPKNFSSKHTLTIDGRDPQFRPFAQGIYATVYVKMNYARSLRSAYCTGVMIQRSGRRATIATNHHCLNPYDEPEDNELNSEILASADCANSLFVYFYAVQGLEQHIKEATCVSGTVKTAYPYDLATFEVEGDIPKMARPLRLRTTILSTEATAYVVHFSAKQPKTLEYTSTPPEHSSRRKLFASTSVHLPAAHITFQDCYIKPPIASTLPYNLVLYFSPAHEKKGYFHTCGTLKGASGAAIIDARTHEIIGINRGLLFMDFFGYFEEKIYQAEPSYILLGSALTSAP